MCLVNNRHSHSLVCLQLPPVHRPFRLSQMCYGFVWFRGTTTTEQDGASSSNGRVGASWQQSIGSNARARLNKKCEQQGLNCFLAFYRRSLTRATTMAGRVPRVLAAVLHQFGGHEFCHSRLLAIKLEVFDAAASSFSLVCPNNT